VTLGRPPVHPEELREGPGTDPIVAVSTAREDAEMTTTTHTPLPRPRSGRVAAGASTDRIRIPASRERRQETDARLGWWAVTVLGLVFLVATGSLSAPLLVLAAMALVAWGMLDTEEASA